MMINFYKPDGSFFGRCPDRGDTKITHKLEDGYKTASFSFDLNKFQSMNGGFGVMISPEMYADIDGIRYVIKSIDFSSIPKISVDCDEDIDDLKFPIVSMSFENKKLSAIFTVLNDITGWLFYFDSSVSPGLKSVMTRTISVENTNGLDLLKIIKESYGCEMIMDSKRKKVRVIDIRRQINGAKLIPGLNLKRISIKKTSENFCTVLIPIGADGLKINDVNDGKSYVENFDYVNKERSMIWYDSTYTDAQQLKDDAELKLKDMQRLKISPILSTTPSLTAEPFAIRQQDLALWRLLPCAAGLGSLAQKPQRKISLKLETR